MISYSAIVTGTDGSDTSLYAVRSAASLAATYDAVLTIVCAHHIDAGTLTSPTHVEMNSIPVYSKERALEILAEAQAYAEAEGAMTVNIRAVPGAPVPALLSVVDELDADLVVVGNRGLDSLLGRITGNIPGAITRKAKVDVMLVNTDHEQ
ncbi:universal stress protein [Corynebacterium kutscheri]|uniref:Universal stress protein n=1 Tax=Corynebacterium kutscheri TaxID=35755 RepID=A0A0F6QZF3_9CORY|nr:universal stress protein [Corynebacterium kutscheri]AKE41122.1 universal stress protein UspA-like protein [Corynebacterium kutscheri]VEH07030.1 universal stress protein [Corynebacterium kutscheri]VEH09440.1 universal stress protein [Corynebacterium kutscheri]VEH79526.1 universal stress protein [Corynebacterium kutscheri]